jgi:hypothetical protein
MGRKRMRHAMYEKIVKCFPPDILGFGNDEARLNEPSDRRVDL